MGIVLSLDLAHRMTSDRLTKENKKDLEGWIKPVNEMTDQIRKIMWAETVVLCVKMITNTVVHSQKILVVNTSL